MGVVQRYRVEHETRYAYRVPGSQAWQLAHLTPPLPGEAIAVGGTARALRKLVGRRLGRDELKEALRMLRKSEAHTLAGRHGIDLWRVRALPAGAAILLELQGLLGVPFEAGRGGLRVPVAAGLAPARGLGWGGVTGGVVREAWAGAGAADRGRVVRRAGVQEGVA